MDYFSFINAYFRVYLGSVEKAKHIIYRALKFNQF